MACGASNSTYLHYTMVAHYQNGESARLEKYS